MGAVFRRGVWPGRDRDAVGTDPVGRSGGRHVPTVVVASGDRAQRQVLDRRLRRTGFRVCAVSDGPSAVAAAEESRPAAVVLEWLMPGAGGMAVCVRLRRHPTLNRVPVVLIAARGDDAQVAEGFRAGADEVFTQPFEVAELIGFLRRTVTWAGLRGRV